MEPNDKSKQPEGDWTEKKQRFSKNHIFTLEDLLNLFPQKV